ncbi:MAG TPA: alpha/beta fold hydrolase [Steroidobacteraceae bacterium]|nr:alpha/beta fold hydrolase [Steroidobacteraceae bacterium]
MRSQRVAQYASNAEPRVRRAYFDCRFGQLHMHFAMPTGGGFDEGTSVLCIAGEAGSGRWFQPLLAPLGRTRSVYAPDLPGRGESDPPPEGSGPDALAAALLDFLDSMRIRQVDVIVAGSGQSIARALTAARPGLVRNTLQAAEGQSAQDMLEKALRSLVT